MTAPRSGENVATLRRATRREGRQLALSAVFEAEFGQRTASAILERHLEENDAPSGAASLARDLVGAVMLHRDSIDARLARLAPQYPVGQLARMDRALLRSGLGEVLHCPATPPRVAIAEWVEMARTYSGEPARRLLNGVLGRAATEVGTEKHSPASAGQPQDGP
ncbi:transcription antitermination factor NusB [soil metagenome]